MSKSSYTLVDPAFFDFYDRNNKPCRGADQMWFRDPWQQRAGCGPTTAATCLSYLAARHEQLAPLSDAPAHEAEAFADYMEQVWIHVTPTNRGLNSLSLYYDGCLSFAKARGLTLNYRALEIGGRNRCGRTSLASCEAFVTQTLAEDMPLAFLNFSNGSLQNLDSWHWVPLIAAQRAQSGALLCAILDEGLEKHIDLSLWYRSTYLGGGLVCLLP